GDSYHISRFYDKNFAAKLEQLIINNHYDIIQLEAPFVGAYLPLIRAICKVPVVLRAHNVDHLIWERLAANCKNPIKAAYLSLQATRLKRFELQLAKDVAGIVSISDADFSY